MARCGRGGATKGITCSHACLPVQVVWRGGGRATPAAHTQVGRHPAARERRQVAMPGAAAAALTGEL